MKNAGGVNYPNPVTIVRERLIFVRFDKTDPASLSTPIYFPTDDVLRGKVITGVQCMRALNTNDQLTGNTILTDAGYIGQYFNSSLLNYFTLTLVGANNEILVNDMPLACLVFDNNFGKIRRFSMMIDLSKSYVRNFGLTSLPSNAVIPIQFYYKNVNE